MTNAFIGGRFRIWMVSCIEATDIFTLSDMTSHKRIGILTSGGDCAGLNAAIRAAVHRAID